MDSTLVGRTRRSRKRRGDQGGTGRITLYHGTSLRRLRNILDDGLQPRGDDDLGNWSGFPSKAGFVYLTDAYAGFFAQTSLDRTDPDDLPVIVEVKVDERNLYPDEDILAQVWAEAAGRPLREVHDMIDPKQHQDLWRDSLEGLGNVAHFGSIQPARVSRVAFLSDPMYWVNTVVEVTVLNYSLSAEWHRQMIRLAFGDVTGVDPYAVTIMGLTGDVHRQSDERTRRGATPPYTVDPADRLVVYRPSRDVDAFEDRLHRWMEERGVSNPFYHQDGDDDWLDEPLHGGHTSAKRVG